MERLYVAYYFASWDDGHDVGSFYFYSTHRANSKPNIEDAIRAYREEFGRWHMVEITETRLKHWR